MMADNGRPLSTLGPIAARGVTTGRRIKALRVRAGQHVMYAVGIATPTEGLAFFGQGCLLVDVSCIRVEVFDALGHNGALGVLPRTFADAVARVDARIPTRCCRAQIGAPVGTGRASGLSKRQAVRIGTFETTEIGTIALADAGNEERHACLLGMHGGSQTKPRQRGNG